MKTVFDTQYRQELVDRLDQLEAGSIHIWGQMNAPQMLKHCRIWEEMIHENKRYPRPLIGRLIGPLILKSFMKNPELQKGSPTIPEMRITETDIDFGQEKSRLVSLLNSYTAYNQPKGSFIHPFFGKMTREQIGQMAYKHLDQSSKAIWPVGQGYAKD